MTRRQFIKTGALWLPVSGMGATMSVLVGTRAGRVVQSFPPNTCPADGSPSSSYDTSADVQGLGTFTSQYYVGQVGWSDASARTICKVGFKLGYGSGDISGFTYTARIHTVTGINLNAIVATSDGVAGSNSWSATWVYFTFPSPYTTTGSVEYAFTVSRGGTSETNYALFSYNPASGGFPGTHDTFTSGGTASIGSDFESAIKLYWQ